MAVSVIVIGNGRVDVTEDEESVRLTAEPVDGFDFKHYILNGEEIPQREYIFPEPSGDVSVSAVFYESVNSYLQGCAPFDISGFIPGVLRGRGISYREDISVLDDRTLELCEADLYLRMARLPSSIHHEKDADDGWSHDGGSIAISDNYRSMLTADALTIYNKYDDPKAKEVQAATLNKKTIVEYNYSRPEMTRPPIKVTVNRL